MAAKTKRTTVTPPASSNIPSVRPGIVAVSRDCFPIDLSRRRRRAVIEAVRTRGLELAEIETIIEHERDVPTALEELERAGVDALTVPAQ